MNLLPLADLCLRFGLVQRATYHPDGYTPETDTTHSLMLALVAMEVVTALDLPLDRARLLSLALVHDLPEAHAGDTNTLGGLSAAGRAMKAAREAAALDQIRADLGSSWLVQAIELYERQEVPEARFVRYLDKVLPRLTHALNGCAAVKRQGRSLDYLRRHHREQAAELAAQYPEWAPILDPILTAACDAAESAFTAGDEP